MSESSFILMGHTTSGWYDSHRCNYCGVVHLGGDGKPITCPRLAPPLPAIPSMWPVPHCPGCRCNEPKETP